MDNELKKTISIKIKRLDMFPNHFFGIAEIDKEEYKINIQGQSVFREKLIKLPIKFRDEKFLLCLVHCFDHLWRKGIWIRDRDASA